jgi:hypothetical protein
LEGHSVIFLAIQTHFSCHFHLAVDFLSLRRGGSSPQIIDQAQDYSIAGSQPTATASVRDAVRSKP